TLRPKLPRESDVAVVALRRANLLKAVARELIVHGLDEGIDRLVADALHQRVVIVSPFSPTLRQQRPAPRGVGLVPRLQVVRDHRIVCIHPLASFCVSAAPVPSTSSAMHPPYREQRRGSITSEVMGSPCAVV